MDSNVETGVRNIVKDAIGALYSQIKYIFDGIFNHTETTTEEDKKMKDMKDVINEMLSVMNQVDAEHQVPGGEQEGNATELMEKESKEPQHNGGNESISQWAKEEEAEPEHKQSTQDKSLVEWAQEEDAEPDLSIGPDGKLYICDKPLGDPEEICNKIQELMKAGESANNVGDANVKVTLIKAIPKQEGGDENASNASTDTEQPSK